MNRKRGVGNGIVAGVLGLGLLAACQAADLMIQSFDGAGQLVFNTLSNATNYSVEWAPSPAGPWTNRWAPPAHIPAVQTGSVTCAVPMCFRVVATLQPEMLIASDTNALAKLPPRCLQPAR
jgi:hypothetical protein